MTFDTRVLSLIVEGRAKTAGAIQSLLAAKDGVCRDDYYRKVDRAIQKNRRKGLISWNSAGRYWEATGRSAFAIEIEQGDVILNSVRLLVDAPDVKVLHIDCTTKNPAATTGTSVGSGSERLEVILYATGGSLFAGLGPFFTKIILPELPGKWITFAEVSKYDVYVTAVRQSDGAPALFLRGENDSWGELSAEQIKRLGE